MGSLSQVLKHLSAKDLCNLMATDRFWSTFGASLVGVMVLLRL